jgi:hypothetical protein
MLIGEIGKKRPLRHFCVDIRIILENVLKKLGLRI